jgi:hypothetical protein
MSKFWIAVLHLSIGLILGGVVGFIAGFYQGVGHSGAMVRRRFIERGLERELTRFIALLE